MAKLSRFEVFVGGMATACAVATIAIACWKIWPDPQVFGTKGEWAGALGGFAAALTAIGISLWVHRRSKIESMMEGAFEIVAADYVIRQIQGQAYAFKRRLKNFADRLAYINAQISRCEQIVDEAQSVQVSNPSGASSLYDQVIRVERQLETLELEKDEASTKARQEFAGYVELLQAQATTLSHVKMAVFNPAVGLAVVKTKALLRRSEGFVKMAGTAPELLECLNKVLELLKIVEGAVSAAERHIKQMAEGH